VEGDKELVSKTFANESGGHRWQRIPPTERNGRVQTSTVTVATFPEPEPYQFSVVPTDLEWTATRSGGKGGQHANVTDSCIVLKHVPSGLVVRCENERSQKRNKESALAVLTARLYAADTQRRSSAEAHDRRSQIGSGQRGDKRRTIRVKDGVVTDHILNKKWKYSNYAKGEW
jgi:peptide chain release factor 1